MQRKESLWWMAATVASLAAFSFFAGLGLRGLFERLNQSGLTSSESVLNLRRIASANPQAADADLQPQWLFRDVLQKLQIFYVEPLPSETEMSLGSVEAMLNELKDPNTRLLRKAEVDALRGAANGEYLGLGAVLTITRSKRPTTAAAEPAKPAPGRGGPAVKPGSPGKAAPGTSSDLGPRTITVVATAPNGPAEKAGILPGDRITEIDGHWIAPAHVSYRLRSQLTDNLGPQDGRPRAADEEPENPAADPQREKERKAAEEEAEAARRRWTNATDLPAVLPMLISSRTGEHELTIERGPGSKTVKVRVKFEPVKAETFTARTLDPQTGYLQILAFNDGTPGQVADALGKFQKDGVKNLVVDLRRSPGGSLESARRVAAMILGEAKFAVLKVRNDDRKLVDQVLAGAKGTAPAFRPSAVSVLVDGGTAGASELFAAALRDNLGARLVGSQTFGDGTEQEVIRLENGAGVSITRAKMLTSRGEEFDGRGLKADVAPQGDPLEAAVRALAGAGRPAAAAVRG